MSKKLCNTASNLHFHTQELKAKLKAIYNAKEDMKRYPNTPKYDLIVDFLLPKLESEVKEEKSSIEIWSNILLESEYTGHENYEEWYI